MDGSKSSLRIIRLVSLFLLALALMSFNGCMSIHTAAEAGNVGCVKTWLALGVSPNSDFCWYANTPLIKGAAYGRIEVVKLLLEKGADVNKHNEGGETPLHYAARHGHVKVMEILLDHGADPTKKGTGCGTPMQWAGSRGQIRAIKMLMRYGVSINQPGSGDTTALHEAAEHDHPDAVRFLLENGANVNARTESGCTPFFLASAGKGNIEIGRILLEYGADPTIECNGRSVSEEFLRSVGQYESKDAEKPD
jgi:ankyrin repeat protein